MKRKIYIIALSFLVICYLFTFNALAANWRAPITAKAQGLQPSSVFIGRGRDPNGPGEWPAAPLMPNYSAVLTIQGPGGAKYGEIIKSSDSDLKVSLLVEVGIPPYEYDPNFDFGTDPNAGPVADAGKPGFFPLLSWDPNIIGSGKMELRLGDANGPVRVPDMKTTNEYQTEQADADSTGYYDSINSEARMRYFVSTTGAIQEIPLCQGWNLISYQINQCFYEGTAPTAFIPQGVIEQDVGTLAEWLSNDTNSPLRDDADPNKAGNWRRVIGFYGGAAYMMDSEDPPQYNTLKFISAGYGYWIKMNAPGTLVLEGEFLPSNTPIVLQNGWNLIGQIPSDTCHADIAQGSICPYTSGVYSSGEVTYCSIDPLVPSVFASIEGKYRRIIGYDCCNLATMYDTQDPPQYNTLHYIGPKYGFWIKIEDPEGAELIFPENCASP